MISINELIKTLNYSNNLHLNPFLEITYNDEDKHHNSEGSELALRSILQLSL